VDRLDHGHGGPFTYDKLHVIDYSDNWPVGNYNVKFGGTSERLHKKDKDGRYYGGHLPPATLARLSSTSQ